MVVLLWGYVCLVFRPEKDTCRACAQAAHAVRSAGPDDQRTEIATLVIVLAR